MRHPSLDNASSHPFELDREPLEGVALRGGAALVKSLYVTEHQDVTVEGHLSSSPM